MGNKILDGRSPYPKRGFSRKGPRNKGFASTWTGRMQLCKSTDKNRAATDYQACARSTDQSSTACRQCWKPASCRKKTKRLRFDEVDYPKVKTEGEESR